MVNTIIDFTILLFLLLNPFLIIIYLIDLVQQYDRRAVTRVLIRSGMISAVVFIIFAVVGEAIFTQVLQARFESMQIFGGIIFLIIGIQFVFTGNQAIQSLRGEPEHIAGAIAMPIMIGPGTVSACILASKQFPTLEVVGSILVAITISVMIMILLKWLHDFVKPRNERLIERYVEIAGRITALVVGTFSIEMIMQGLKAWIQVL